MSKRKSPPIMENPHVRELLSVMEKYHTDAMKDLLDVIGYVGEVEKQLDNAVQELAAMRKELADMRGQPAPVQKTMRDATILMQDRVITLRENLAALKAAIVEGCKNLLSAFKEKGTQALHNTARFFKLRPALETLRDNLNDSIKSDERIIAKIEAVSTEYHKAGQHIKNMGRALTGKEAVADAKAPGKVAKTFAAPFHAERSCLLSAKKSVENAIGRLARLEKAAERKPSIKQTIKEFNYQIANAPKSAPNRAAQHGER